LAEIETCVDAETRDVATVNVADVAPAATITFAGNVATAVLLLVSATSAPPTGAGADRVSVPVDDAVAITVEGLRATDDTVSGFTISIADWLLELRMPVTDTCVDAPTTDVATLNAAVVAPSATVIFGGTLATAVLLLARDTTSPPVGAGAFRVTVALDDDQPPTTEVGFRPIEATARGFTVNVPDWLLEL